MATVRAEGLAVEALRDYLLRTLPAKVIAVNATRSAIIKTPIAEPFNVPGAATLKLRSQSTNLTFPLTPGAARTAAQIKADVDAVLPGVAAVDAKLRVSLQGSGAPSAGTQSSLEVLSDSTGANIALGFDPGGELVVRDPLVAPGRKGIVDGDFALVDIVTGFGITFGDKVVTEVRNNIRYKERAVAIQTQLYVPLQAMNPFLSSEAVESAVRCVREVIFEDRTLDAQVQLTLIDNVTVRGPVFAVSSGPGGSLLVATATMKIRVNVYEANS